MPTINFVFDAEEWGAPMVRYVLQFLEQHPLSPEGLEILTNQEEEGAGLSIGYGEGKAHLPFFIPRQRLLFQSAAPSPEDWVANGYRYEGRTVYAVEKDSKKTQFFLEPGRHFGFDLIEALFFHLSRYEEYYCPDTQKNEHGEMEEESHFLVRHGLQRIPVVDHLVYCFFAALGLQPRALRAAFFLTHDVDYISKFTSAWQLLRPAVKFLLFRPSFSALQKLFTSYAKKLSGSGKDPYDVFDWMLQGNVSDKKVLFLLAGGQTKYDGDYQLGNRRIIELIGLARQRGYQLGLHPSYATWTDANLLKEELERLKQTLGEEVKYTRQHFLHYDHRITPYILEALGMEVDSSYGYNQRIGFRCGTGFPYQPFSFEEQRPFHFWELPLVVMDSALLKEGNYRAEEVERLWRDIIDSNPALTQMAFNFHNSRFDDAWLHGIPLKKYLKEVSDNL